MDNGVTRIILPWILSSLFGVVMVIGGAAFSRWADVIDKARIDLVLLKEQIILNNENHKDTVVYLEKMHKRLLIVEDQLRHLTLPPQPTRDRIEAIEESLYSKGYRPPTKKWQ